MQIRSAVLTDALAIAEVHVAAWRAAYRGVIPDTTLESLSVPARNAHWSDAIQRGTPSILVAVPVDSVAGWIAFGPCRDPDKPSHTGELWAMYVSPEHWSGGIGRALWLAAGEQLRGGGFRSVTLWVLAQNARACHFYHRVGFRPDPAASKIRDIGGVSLAEVRYEAQIAA